MLGAVLVAAIRLGVEVRYDSRARRPYEVLRHLRQPEPSFDPPQSTDQLLHTRIIISIIFILNNCYSL